jgi:hypothetical protein
MNTYTLSVTTIHQEIAEAIVKGVNSWMHAGELIKTAIDEQGETSKSISEAINIPVRVIGQLEKIGRKLIRPDLLMAGYPAALALMRLPYSLQSSAIEDGVDLLVHEADSMKVKAENLTHDQVKQVFDGSNVRSLAGQKAYLEDLRIKASLNAIPDVTAPYQIKGNKVLISSACSLTQKDLLRMLQEISN